MTRGHNAVSVSRPACALCLDVNSKCAHYVRPGNLPQCNPSFANRLEFPGDMVAQYRGCPKMQEHVATCFAKEAFPDRSPHHASRSDARKIICPLRMAPCRFSMCDSRRVLYFRE